MELSNQVCSLSQAKRLKELGVKAESLFYYRQEKLFPFNPTPIITKREFPTGLDVEAFDIYSAFTVAELGVMLPDSIRIFKSPIGWEYKLPDKDNDWTNWRKFNTEAEARSEVLIYLLESGTIKAEDINSPQT